MAHDEDPRSAGREGWTLTASDPQVPPAAADGTAAPARSLGQQAMRGAAVTILGQGGRVVLQMASVVVLARLLAPSEFGLMAMVLLFVGLGEVFRDFGLSSAAIQAPSLSREQRDLLFWTNTGIGVILALAIFAGAGLIAALFGQPELVGIAQALSVTFVFNGMATQYRAGLNRQMKFRALAVVSVGGQAVGLVAAVVTAVLGAGYWALVAQQVAVAAGTLLLFLLFARWIPGPPRRGVPIRHFFRYGWQLMATQLVGYAANNTDNLIIGLRFGVDSLGLYNRAFQLLMNPLNQLRTPATTVALPVLSRLQDDDDRFAAFVVRAQLILGFTIVPALAVGAGVATPLVDVLLGAQWYAAAPLFAAIAIAGIFHMLAFVGYWVYLSRALTGPLLQFTIVAFVIRVACIGIGSQWGLIGVAVGYALEPALTWPLSLWWVSRYAPLPLRALWWGAGRALMVATAAAAAAWATVTLGIPDLPAMVALLVGSIAGIAVYAIAALHPRLRADLTIVVGAARVILRRRGH